ncbi:MAG: RecB family exonuclease [Nocardioides sp.]
MSGSRSPADRHSTVVDGVEVVGALSPSRAGDFLACPLLYRFRTIDKRPEPPSPDAVRGTVIHRVLERLFDLPAPERTKQRARSMLIPAWEQFVESEPSALDLFRANSTGFASWLTSCHDVLDRYFTLEDPTRLEPAEREVYVETLLDSRLLLRGFVDRVDVTPDGLIRVVDYKTGRSPGPQWEAKALFQMKFYALIIWRARGVVPRVLQLIYLGNSEVLRYTPEVADLVATERKVTAIFDAITRAERDQDWRPNPSRLCGACAHQAICPAFGGTPPALPTARDRESDAGTL